MLNNEKFLANAPVKVVEENRKKLDDLKEQIEKVNDELENFPKS